MHVATWSFITSRQFDISGILVLAVDIDRAIRAAGLSMLLPFKTCAVNAELNI